MNEVKKVQCEELAMSKFGLEQKRLDADTTARYRNYLESITFGGDIGGSRLGAGSRAERKDPSPST